MTDPLLPEIEFEQDLTWDKPTEFQSNHYRIHVGTAEDPEYHLRVVYQVVNKIHGVVEAETSALPSALDFMEQLDASLSAKLQVRSEFDEGGVPPPIMHS